MAKGKTTTVVMNIALRKLRQGDCELKASLKLCQKKREGEGRELALIERVQHWYDFISKICTKSSFLENSQMEMGDILK